MHKIKAFGKLQAAFFLYYILRFVLSPILFIREKLLIHREFLTDAETLPARNMTDVLVISCYLPSSSRELRAMHEAISNYAGEKHVKIIELDQAQVWSEVKKLIFDSVVRESFSHIVLTYPAALGPRLTSLWRNYRLRHRFKGPLVAFLWDVEDPLHNLRILALTSRRTCLVSGAHTEKQVSRAFGRRFPVVAPAPEIWWSQSRVKLSVKWIDWSHREYDLLIPSNLYSGRAETVLSILKYLELSKDSYQLCEGWIHPTEYFSTFANCRVILNTSRIGSSLRFGYPGFGKDFGTKMVGRVADALVAGSLLVTERSPALMAFGHEGVHYLAFSSPEEAVEKISWALLSENSVVVQGIAREGQRWILERIRQSKAWRDLDDTLRGRGLARIGLDIPD